MMFIKTIASTVSAFVLAGSVYAGQNQVCPSLDDIKAEGITMSERIAMNLFFAYNISSYNLDGVWGFVIAPIEADSNDEAIENANDVLNTMTGSGSVEENEENQLICMYNTGNPDLMAAAVKTDMMMSPNQLRKIAQKMRTK